ncbi:MAG: nucleoside kinase [Bacteroidales bacterium]|nr:nucleoside kinase [Bacteroidales bacterium]
MVKIVCKNTGAEMEFQEGVSLLEVLPYFDIKSPFPIISAKVNNVSQGLKYRAFNSKTVEFLDYTSSSGKRVYCRSLCFLLAKAAADVFPGSRIYIEHSISNGYYCNFHKSDDSKFTAEDVAAIRAQMKALVNKNIQFHRLEVPVEEAVRIFREQHSLDKVRLLETIGQPYTDYYMLDGMADYYYGRLVPSTGYLNVWGLEPYHNGMLLRVPDRDNPSMLAPFVDQPKTYEMFAENLRWNIIMRLNTVGDLNHALQEGMGSELIQVSEALQEKKIVQIAEEIERRYNDRKHPLRLVLITGPSSSGKTTFCKRLSVQLNACGLRPLSFSTDDYFVNRVDTPKLPDGSYDFDNFDTVDHDALQADLVKLLRGETVQVPEYNFVTGIREYNGKKLSLRPGCVLLVEGIHALNPRLTDQIPEESKYRIFISTLTNIALDNHNWVPTSDNRLLRRIVRDYNKGAFTARETISQWPNVRRAEEQWIYPYQECADVMFNSAYLVEFAVLRNHAEPILSSVPKNCPEYSEAHRLLKFIHYFTPVPDKEIPATSLLREFVGGSSFGI